MTQFTATHIAACIEHTLLKPNVSETEIVRLCDEAQMNGFLAVCVNPYWVTTAVAHLKGSPVKVVTVAGFPLGANEPEIKIRESLFAAERGATEIDVVANIGLLVSGHLAQAEEELEELRRQLPASVGLKVIIESSLLTTELQMDAVRMAINSGAQFVKSGTGFQGPVTVEQIQVMTMAAHGEILIKASGGIRTAHQCQQLIGAGASRIGTSSGVEIMRDLGNFSHKE
ncbi:MAG: deoxyribose-phosphate aldolase [Candidatus Zixiibacteriota bacterium]